MGFWKLISLSTFLFFSLQILVSTRGSLKGKMSLDRSEPRYKANSEYSKIEENGRTPFHFPIPIFKNPKDYEKGWPWDLKIVGEENSTVPAEVKGTESLPVDENGRVQMGISSDNCDNGKTNLTMDWDDSPLNYTCFHPESPFPENPSLPHPHVMECITLPPDYMPDHVCMDKPIHYNHPIPSYGDHRPLWPKYGEYLFVPPQRWLHNIEHGAVVMLYHPCTHPSLVNLLRNIVRECFGKHVITPSILLPKERPVALVTWGCRFLMADVNEKSVIQFIQEKSQKGPEGHYTKEGQYDYALLRSANETSIAQYAQVTCTIPTH